MNEANTTPTCCCTQETTAPAKHSLNNIVETATPKEHSFDNIAEPCEELSPTPDPNIPRTTLINANLSQLEKNQLTALLKEYADVFA